MRNLKLQSCKQLSSKVSNVKYLLLDPNASRKEIDSLAFVVTDSQLYEVKTSTGISKEIAAVPGIVAAEYLALNNEICLATEAGEVLAVSPSTGAINECTFCDVGLQCMSWSPDQEVGVFITKSGNVVVMTCTYDVIHEHVLKEQCDPDSQFVNVGWGKKETQFHGKEGKAAAKMTTDFKPPEHVEQLAQDIEITWRADGAYFAVSFVSAEAGRMFKVFNKEGDLTYISERWNDLQPPIAWRPSGTWIAMPQIFPNKSTVSLFEKNGLRHREIVLPFSLNDEPIRSLRWSNDSDILAIETLDASTQNQNLYLYTIGNYHWYLKQVLTFNRTERLLCHCWDQRIGEEKTLHIWLESGRYLIYRWRFEFDRYARSGIVAVIDGKKLLLTDFSKAVVPPPMCSKEIHSDAYINACVISKNNHEELQLCIYDANEELQLYRVYRDGKSLDFERVSVMQKMQIELDLCSGPPLELANMFWFEENCLVATVNIGEKSKVLLIALDELVGAYSIAAVLQLNSNAVSSCMGFVMLEQCFVQTINGKVEQTSLHSANSLKLDKTYQQLEQNALQMEWHQTQSAQGDCLIALLNNQRLYIDSQLVSGDVTSFCLAGNYLAYTKLTELNFVLLSTRQNVYKRNMERGGRLVTTIVNDARVVLQMPRGNLEVISPRVLALEIIGKLLDQQRYHDAFDMLRKQRINLNIICDHNLVRFVNNVHIFLSEITNPNWLNLFLTDLQNEDFSKTMYAGNYTAAEQAYPEDFNIESKVVYLCELLCTHMTKSGYERFRSPIITAYVKLGKLEQALQLIWHVKKQQNELAKKSDEPVQEAAEEALKYLLYLVDVNELYNVALGTYDFGLVLFVAQKSQKDPKEFLPFLNELKQLEVNYRRFKIDEHLKRHVKALENILKCGAEKFDVALEFIKRHGLYRQALQFYKLVKEENKSEEQLNSLDECQRQICLAFADHLRAKNELDSASIMYERGGNLPQALLSAKHVLDWRRVLMLAQKDGIDIATLALSMVPALQEQGRYDIAHKLHKTYGTNFREALQCLLKGNLYLEAILEARLNIEEANLLDELVRPELLAYTVQLQQQLADDEKLFVEHKQRLQVVRVLAQQKRDGLLNGYDQPDIDEADLLSDTTSLRSSRYTGSSQGTGKTFRSSKNRRKHERKLLSLKPGNPFEDIALIDALYNQVMKLANQQQQVRDTCKALLELQRDEVAAALQTQYGHLLALLQDSFDAIWTDELLNAQAMQYKPTPYTDYTQLQNEQRFAVLAPQKRFKPQITLIDWKCDVLA
ncbi:putative elongator complex protein 1 [Rhagoletis pomonella]|uniref:putative elongator complex protein 1 n=1 Tax=Rhagoletis pomonella TaxID=28610 RepID=UPI00177FC7CA|nr:putative elongator complex protein 1 [Rhagoletis pomonella]